MTEKQGKKLFTVQEAADYLGVSRMKIYRLLESGDLTALINPLDKRQKLISIDQLSKLKGLQFDMEGDNTEGKNSRQKALNPLAA